MKVCSPSIVRLSHNQRPGSVYIAVLGVAIIVAVIGISSLHIARLEVRESVAVDEMARARVAARSGIECVLASLKANLLWRTTYISGATNQLAHLSGPLEGTDSFQFVLRDTDGSLNDDPDDSLTIRCVGTAGNARHVIEVMLAPSGDGLSCLGAALHASGDVNVDAIMTTNQVISSNEDIRASGSSIQGNAQAVGDINGSVTGTKNKNMNPPLEMPDANSVLEYYLAVGTPIAYGQIPGGAIDKVVLSATSNPYGLQTTNQQGIYVIDCQGNNLAIRNSRIQATVVLVNVGPLSGISNSVNWESTVANFPALIVQGSFIMNWTQYTSLSESTTGANFNPSQAPYLGNADSDKTDTYPSIIKGLVYVTGSLYITNQASLEGVTVVGGIVSSYSASDFKYKPIYLSNAPPGFTSGNDMKLVPGTWKQTSY